MVRQRSAKPPFSGSNPEAASKNLPAGSSDFAGVFLQVCKLLSTDFVSGNVVQKFR